MKRFIQSEDRSQCTLFPDCLDDYIAEDNPVRVIDVFVNELDLVKLGFERSEPKATGRPAYHPSTLLKIYIYGYLNRVQSSRRLERETQRNVELMWLTGRLTPDFKTIADFRKDNGAAIRRVCREFIVLCRNLNLFAETIVAIDGSKFKAVNNRDKNFTDRKLQARMEQLEESVGRYLAELDRADREPTAVNEERVPRLKEKIIRIKEQMRRIVQIGAQMQATPDRQISLTDPDARSMATSGRGTGMVGYNVQTVVDAKHHLIIAHEVTNRGHDRQQLAPMAQQAGQAIGNEHLTVLADRGYFNSEQIRKCEQGGIATIGPHLRQWFGASEVLRVGSVHRRNTWRSTRRSRRRGKCGRNGKRHNGEIPAIEKCPESQCPCGLAGFCFFCRQEIFPAMKWHHPE